MEIIIVGAGIGGLSAALSLALAGHKVIILESASALAEIGAGVQMTPNATKCFWKWGLGPDILSNSALPESFNILRGGDGSVLGHVPFEDFDRVYGAPYIVIHRADIHQVLHKHAIKAGVELRLGSRVIHYDFEIGIVRLEEGMELQADILIAVDGINSVARKAFLPDVGDGLEKTGWAAYRTMASVDKIKANPKTAHIVAQHKCNCWVGDGKLVMSYLVKNAEMLNLVLSHPDDVNTSEWTSEQYQAELKQLYSNWDPALAALLDIASPNIQNWPVHQVNSLSKWTSKSGKFVLMGDVCTCDLEQPKIQNQMLIIFRPLMPWLSTSQWVSPWQSRMPKLLQNV
jgi:salicylate hydroxylase